VTQSRARVIDSVSPLADHFLFLLIFVIGAISICFFRLATNLPAIFALVIPLVLMSFYAFVIWRTERYRLREDRAADNLYYLGFLFTVTALMVALIRYKMSVSPDVNQIIGDLGLGLMTTVVGLLGRVFFGQLRQDPEEIEERTRLMLVNVAEHTRSQLIATTDLIEDVNAQSRRIMLDANERIKLTNNTVIESISDLERKLNAIDLPDDIITSRMDPIFDRVEKTVSSLIMKLDAIQISPDVINERGKDIFRPLAGSLRNLGETLNDVDEAFVNLARHREEISGFAKTTEELIKSKESLARWADTIVENEKQLSGLNKAFQETHTTISHSTKAIETLVVESKAQQKIYREAINDMVKTISAAQTEIRRLSETTHTLTQEFSGAMRELVDLANEASRD